MPEAGDEVAAVVAGQGLPQSGLYGRAALRAFEAFSEDGLHGAQVLAGVECRDRCKTQTIEVARVDLCQADAEIPALLIQRVGRGHGFGQAAWLPVQHPADNANGMRVHAALDRHQRPGRVRMHQRCTDRSQHRECVEVHARTQQVGQGGCGGGSEDSHNA